MAPITLFTPSTPLRVRSNLRPACTSSPVCTLTPERAPAAQKPATRYRVLPDDMPATERPPPPPRHRSIPYVGFFLELALGLRPGTEETYRKRGRIYQSDYMFAMLTYVVDYQTIVEVMRNTAVFRSEGAFQRMAIMFGADAIITLDGDAHKAARTAAAPAFAPALLPHYFARVLARVRKTWERAAARGSAFRLEPLFREHYLTITIEMTTGLRMDGADATRIRRLYHKVQSALFSPEFLPAWNDGRKAQEELMGVLRGVVMNNLAQRADVIEHLREIGDDPVQLGMRNLGRNGIDILIVAMANSPLSTRPGAANDEEVIQALCRSMVLLWFAGYATAAAASMCVSFELGRDNSIRDRLVAEQAAVVAAAGGDPAVTYTQVASQMPLLDSFIMEMLRMHAPGSGVVRKAAYDVEVLGHFVPRDSIVYLDFAGAMYDPAIYDDPTAIRLDRFVRKEGVPGPPPVLAFGAPGSPHYCLGAAFAKVLMKSTFAMLLREYTYSLDPNQSQAYNIVPEAVPKSGIVVEKFERRVSL